MAATIIPITNNGTITPAAIAPLLLVPLLCSTHVFFLFLYPSGHSDTHSLTLSC